MRNYPALYFLCFRNFNQLLYERNLVADLGGMRETRRRGIVIGRAVYPWEIQGFIFFFANFTIAYIGIYSIKEVKYEIRLRLYHYTNIL